MPKPANAAAVIRTILIAVLAGISKPSAAGLRCPLDFCSESVSVVIFSIWVVNVFPYYRDE